MTSYIDGRDELAAALVSAGVRVDDSFGGEPPYAVVWSDGIGDMRTIVTGRVVWSYRVAMVAGGFAEAGVEAELAALRGTCLTVARALAGWQLVRLDRDSLRELSGSTYRGADLILARMIDL